MTISGRIRYLKGIEFEIDRSVKKKPTESNGAKKKYGLNVLINNRRNKDLTLDEEEEKMDGLSMVDRFQVDEHKVDG